MDAHDELAALRTVATGLGQMARNREKAETAAGDRAAAKYRAIEARVRAAIAIAKRETVTRAAIGPDAGATARDLRNAAKVHRERAARQREVAGADSAHAAKNQALADTLEAIATRLVARS